MKVIVTEDYQKLSEAAFDIMVGVVKENPRAVLGLATGTTPLGLYELMIKDHRENGTSYRQITTVNLDEYAGLGEESDQSYVYFMRRNLFEGLDIDLSNTHIENGKAQDRDNECRRYNELLEKYRQDIQLLGLGSNGHIAFNEPNTPFGEGTHVVKLTESTIRDNSRLFERIEDVPTSAFTMGPKNIMHAKKILILASGASKAHAVRSAVKGRVCEDCPASILQLHPDCTLIVDKAAASLL